MSKRDPVEAFLDFLDGENVAHGDIYNRDRFGTTNDIVSINKLACDADDLRELLECAYENISEIPTDNAEAASPLIARAFSLVWIGRNIAAELARKADVLARQAEADARARAA